MESHIKLGKNTIWKFIVFSPDSDRETKSYFHAPAKSIVQWAP